MKRILHVEDNGLVTDQIGSKLREMGYDIKTAYSYESALDRWDESHGEFDCIILDLHINPAGMSEADIEEFFPMYGIVAFDYFMQNNKDKNNLKQKTIIYSGYIRNFEKMCVQKGWNFDGIRRIEKLSSSIYELIMCVKSICDEQQE